jgi:hypothetical protein
VSTVQSLGGHLAACGGLSWNVPTPVAVQYPLCNWRMVTWNHVTRDDVLRAMQDYDRLGPERFFSKHGFAPATTYELAW